MTELNDSFAGNANCITN